jgi:hypothetical protein
VNEFKYLKRVVIEANNENPSKFQVEQETETADDIYYSGFLQDYPSTLYTREQVINITGINLSSWTVTLETEYVEKFKRVLAALDDDIEAAERVMRALG